MNQEINAMAQQFNVDPGALSCLLQFMQDNLAKSPEAAQAFANASPAQQDAIMKQGVKAWHDHSQRMLGELAEGRTEWAQEARQQIAHDVYHQIRGAAH